MLRFGCAMTESDWLALRLTDQQVCDPRNRVLLLMTEQFANPNYPLRPKLGVRINDFAQRNAQLKANLICDLAQ